MVRYIYGDIVDKQKELEIDIICHQVNCQGKMGSGVAKRIRNAYPIVYTNYMKKCEDEAPSYNLGTIQLVPLYEKYAENGFNPQCCNFFSQFEYGYDGKRYTSYDAFWNCLHLIKQVVPKGKKIGFPARIGCGLGGANWNIISHMIAEVLSEDYIVYVIDLQEDK
jgi:O-acetyl-ADP-ribose deacetylase (regulator of RNase III)